MADVPIEKKRSVALIGHGGCGKTTLAEALLYGTGAVTRLGKVEDGNTVSDYHAEEIKRTYSIFTSAIPVSFGGCKMLFLDTPGYQDFVGEMRSAMSVVDGAVIVVNGQAGVESQTEVSWDCCEEFGLPRVFFISQLEKEGSDYYRVLDSLKKRFGSSVAPLVVPIGEHHDISGVVDLLTETAWFVEGKSAKQGEIPEEMRERVGEMRTALVESIVENDDELMELYLADEEIPEARLIAVMREGVLSGNLVPCTAGSIVNLTGVHPLLNIIRDLLPSPAFRKEVKGTKPGSDVEEVRTADPGEPFSAKVFKVEESPMGNITYLRIYSGKIRPGGNFYNPTSRMSEKPSTLLEMSGKTKKDVNEASAGDIVATVKLKDTHRGDTLCDKEHRILFPRIDYPSPLAFEALNVESQGDLEKVSASLHYYAAEDPTLEFMQDPDTSEMVLKGMGELHLEVHRALVSEKYNVSFQFSEPKIPYRETIKASAISQGKHKKQTGGRGQYGDVWLELQPLARGEGFVFENAVVGGVVPSKFIPAVEKGVNETLKAGVLAGCQVVDIKVRLYDGSHHTVDSSEIAFKTAASIGFKAAFEKASPVLLEPIYMVKVIVPDSFMGEVMGDVNSRRGRLQGMEERDGLKVINANIPLAELYKYVNQLKSLTQGRGSFELDFSHYEEVPSDLAKKVIEGHKRAREEG